MAAIGLADVVRVASDDEIEVPAPHVCCKVECPPIVRYSEDKLDFDLFVLIRFNTGLVY
jgi:hypothetical protein